MYHDMMTNRYSCKLLNIQTYRSDYVCIHCLVGMRVRMLQFCFVFVVFVVFVIVVVCFVLCFWYLSKKNLRWFVFQIICTYDVDRSPQQPNGVG